MTLYTIGHLAKQYGVSTSTIRRWEATGLIAASEPTLGGHRRFRIEDDAGDHERKVVGYARVSSYDQKEDLQRQIVRLRNAGCDEVVSDIGSGLNCKKPGLTEARRIQALGGEKGVESWCGGMVDAGVARGHNIAAATLPHYVYPNDIPSSDRYYADDIVTPST